VDLTNRVKFLEDCVCGALGIDDSRIFRVVLDKLDAEQEQTVIEIKPMAAGQRRAA
jgi:Holliday junction resolvase RusA-like endonuclease